MQHFRWKGRGHVWLWKVETSRARLPEAGAAAARDTQAAAVGRKTTAQHERDNYRQPDPPPTFPSPSRATLTAARITLGRDGKRGSAALAPAASAAPWRRPHQPEPASPERAQPAPIISHCRGAWIPARRPPPPPLLRCCQRGRRTTGGGATAADGEVSIQRSRRRTRGPASRTSRYVSRYALLVRPALVFRWSSQRFPVIC